MVRKRSSRPVNNGPTTGSESTKASGSVVIPKPIEEDSPNPKSSPDHRLLNESEGSIKKARVDVAKNGVEEDEGKDKEDRNVVDNGVNGKVDAVMEDVVENGVEVDKEESDEEDEGKDKEDQNVVDNGANGKVDGTENGVEVDDNKESDEDEEDEDEGKDKENHNVVDSGANGKVGVVENGVEVDKEESDEEDEWKDFREMYPYLSRACESDVSCSELLKSFIMDNIRSVGSVKLPEMDKKWKNLYVEELKLYVKRIDLQKEQAQTMLDQMTTSDS